MFDFKPAAKKRDVARSLYDALGINLSRNLDLEVFKRGKFKLPVGKSGSSLYGRYRHRGGDKHLSNYDMEVGIKLPVDLQGILY